MGTKEQKKVVQDLDAQTVSVGEILKNSALRIPHYQRPYKWQERHVAQLLEDIQRFSEKSAYRLGSLVLHEDQSVLDIVDGQQRTVTLTLILRAFIQHRPDPDNVKLRQHLKNLESELFDPEMNSPVSQRNLQQNYRFIEQRINSFSEEEILFLLENCEFVQFTLHDLSSAFQFFDSQNARGKDLEPHDLLKAFHLRSFSKEDEPSKEAVISQWEKTETKELSGLFRYYLYRIKEWGQGHSARFFTKANVDIFKGINLEQTQDLPFAQVLRMAQVYTKKYNSSPDRSLDGALMYFPFQLEMPIINGRIFFEMTSHYLSLSESLWERVKKQIKSGSNAEKVVVCLESYKHENRQGDKYIKSLLRAVLLQYVDKFGFKDIERIVVHLFLWTYKLRLEKQRVQLATMDNHAFEPGSYLHIIRKSLKPEQVFMTPLPSYIELNYNKTKELQSMFKDLLGDKIFDHE